MFRNSVIIKNIPKTQVRTYLTHNPSMSSGDVLLDRRPKKKIQVGKARPAIYYKFDTVVQLSDGSVVVRRSQTPKAEMKIINDQRNNPMWNPSRKDLTQVYERAAGRLSKFKQKYSLFEDLEEKPNVSEQEAMPQETKAAAKPVEEQPKLQKSEPKKAAMEEEEDDDFSLDDYLELVGENVQEVQSGGKLAKGKKGK